jgi:hypothetical protein
VLSDELHEFRPKEFSAQLFGPDRNSKNFSDRDENHIQKEKVTRLIGRFLRGVNALHSAEQDE